MKVYWAFFSLAFSFSVWSWEIQVKPDGAHLMSVEDKQDFKLETTLKVPYLKEVVKLSEQFELVVYLSEEAGKEISSRLYEAVIYDKKAKKILNEPFIFLTEDLTKGKVIKTEKAKLRVEKDKIVYDFEEEHEEWKIK